MTMKRIALSLSLTLVISALTAQVHEDPIIMTVGQKNITKSEFQYIWKKNNTDTSTDQKLLDDYVNLFVNFKLKVAEAESQGLDKKRSFVDELDSYRRQLVAPYLTDKDAEEWVARLTYDRMREYVEVSHVLIRVAPDAAPEDTLVAWKKAMDVYKQAVSVNADFAALARQYSDDVTKSHGGYIGFVTGMRFFYTFENGIYNTPVGTISAPLRTEYGYHIIKVHSRRPAYGKYRSAHIMKMVKETDTPEAKQKAKEAIFQLYESLKKGEDFARLAKQASEDQSTSGRGGEFGMLYCGSLPIEYEDAVNKLKVGSYSEPFQSSYGWHIVKALEFQKYPSLEEMREDINTIVSRDERSQVPRDMLVERLKKEYGSTIDKQAFDNMVQAYDNLRIKKDSSDVRSLQTSSRRLFTIGTMSYAQKDFAAYLSAKPSLANNVNNAFNGFMKDKVIAFEDKQLEKKYPEFGHLMQEYRDGILLFEVSNKEVWEKAALDTAGLINYFAAHKADYAWEQPRFKGFVIECTSKAVADKVKKAINKIPDDSVVINLNRLFNTTNQPTVRIRQGLFAMGENAVVDSVVFKQKNTKQETAFAVTFLHGRVLKKGPEDYSDVSGLVISDYQNFLEKKWLEALRNKYTVTINQAVVKTVNKN